MHACIARVAEFWRDRRGAIVVEFALVAPLLVLMMLGTFEVTRYILLHQKLDRMAIAAGDLVAQGETITIAQLTDIFAATGLIAEPFTIGNAGVVIVSSAYRATGTSTVQVAWQRTGTGTLGAASTVGTQGGSATLPAGFTLREGESAIIAEVFYEFRPVLAPDLTPPARLFHRAIFRPRRGLLNQIDP